MNLNDILDEIDRAKQANRSIIAGEFRCSVNTFYSIRTSLKELGYSGILSFEEDVGWDFGLFYDQDFGTATYKIRVPCD